MRLETPLCREDLTELRAGQSVHLSGVVFTARDQAHRRILDALDQGAEPPFPLRGQVIFYAGPSPAPPGRVVGAVGPTTSTRMDAFAPALYRRGLAGTIGKGRRGDSVRDAIRETGGVYWVMTGGVAALMARCVQDCTCLAYPDLGPEAVYRMVVRDLPLVVGIDPLGQDVYALTETLVQGGIHG